MVVAVPIDLAIEDYLALKRSLYMNNKKSMTMKFTGERFVPEEIGSIELEHWHRYIKARELAVGKDVLDIASGEGYGSALLAEVANHVTGVDVAADAVAHAASRYVRGNLRYLEGDCAAIPLPDHCVDLIVSFETIEHHDKHEQMMREFKRVLRPNGCLIISSPDRYFYSELPGYSNPYHIKELYCDEFKQLLSAHFENTRYFGQRLVYGSVIFPEVGESVAVHDEMTADGIQSSAGLARPMYWIAVVSDFKLPPLSVGLFEQDLMASEVIREWQLAENKSRERFEDIRKEYNEATAKAEWLYDELEKVRNSTSWKLTLPLRTVHCWSLKQLNRLKRSPVYGFRVVRFFYRKMPLPPSARIKIRKLVLKYNQLTQSFFLRVSSVHAINRDRAMVGTPYTEFPWGSSVIILPKYEQPLVSVILPVYGKCNYTLRCLYSIQCNLPDVPFEVIVIDDCSPDNSFESLSKIQGIRLVRNETNQGFLRSCNFGAKQARGQYLHFLNNDTEVAPGWMDALVHTFDQFPDTGLVGSKLVYPDGVLQEAGGIIWKDGSAWNFGRYQDQLDPLYCYARETDYCSGASIMVPASLFHELGGFDEIYAPAYCEDSDLALRIRSRGKRVIFQPQSVVVHYEGVSNGTDLNSGIKAYQIENMRKQYERWKGFLENYQDNGVDVDAAKDRAATRRVLVIEHCTPTPDRDAGSMIAFNLMLLMREMGFQVTFIPEDNYLYVLGYTDDLQAVGIEVLYHPYCSSVRDHLKKFGDRYDLAILFRPGVMEKHLDDVRLYCLKAKVLYHTVDLHYLRMQREAEVAGIDSIKATTAMKQVEHHSIRQADASIVVSSTEQQLLNAELPGETVCVLPLIMRVPGTKVAFDQRKDIMFVGGYRHAPNVDAVLYFIRDVLPLIHHRLPEVRFFVVGSDIPQHIEALANDKIIITGYVDDLQSMQDRVRVNIAPLRFGAGIKGKIGAAMAAGLPSVATKIAVEGMGLENGENVLVATDAQDLADLICQIYVDEDLWNRLSTQGIGFAEHAWGAQSAWDKLRNILDSLGLPVRHSGRPLTLWSPRPQKNTTKMVGGC